MNTEIQSLTLALADLRAAKKAACPHNGMAAAYLSAAQMHLTSGKADKARASMLRAQQIIRGHAEKPITEVRA